MNFHAAFSADPRELTTEQLHQARGILGATKLDRRRMSGVDFAKFPNAGGKRSAELLEFLKSMNTRLDQINARDMFLQGKSR